MTILEASEILKNINNITIYAAIGLGREYVVDMKRVLNEERWALNFLIYKDVQSLNWQSYGISTIYAPTSDIVTYLSEVSKFEKFEIINLEEWIEEHFAELL